MPTKHNPVEKSINDRKSPSEYQPQAISSDRTTGRERPQVTNRKDSNILDELFPKNAKDITYSSHTLYLNDAHWKKIQRIAKEQNISCSAVITKIFSQIL